MRRGSAMRFDARAGGASPPPRGAPRAGPRRRPRVAEAASRRRRTDLGSSGCAARSRRTRALARLRRRCAPAALRPASAASSDRMPPASDGHRLAVRLTRVVRHELRQGALERRRVDELTLLDDGAPQRGGQLATRREALVARRRQRPQDERLELGRDVLRVRRRRLDDARAHDVEQRLAAEPAVKRAARRGSPRGRRRARRGRCGGRRFSPRACSGDMYPNLPLRTPGSSAKRLALAMPKSAIFTAPSNESRMFCGLTSRWTMSSGCPASSFFSCA